MSQHRCHPRILWRKSSSLLGLSTRIFSRRPRPPVVLSALSLLAPFFRLCSSRSSFSLTSRFRKILGILEEGQVDYLGAYQYAKTTSEKQSWEWVKQEKPPFDLIFLLAPSITGKSIQPGYELTKEHLGGTGTVYRELFDREETGFLIPYFM